MDPKAVYIHFSQNTYTSLICIFNHWKLFSNSTIGTHNGGIFWMKHFKCACSVIILHNAASSLDYGFTHPTTKSTYYFSGTFLTYKMHKMLSIITEINFSLSLSLQTWMKIVLQIQHLKTVIWSCFNTKKMNATWKTFVKKKYT